MENASPSVEMVFIHSEEFVLLVINHVNHVEIFQLNVYNVLKVLSDQMINVLVLVLKEHILIMLKDYAEVAHLPVKLVQLKISVFHAQILIYYLLVVNVIHAFILAIHALKIYLFVMLVSVDSIFLIVNA